ncbi:MAG TPA: nitroreductase/quinone reductase family protein [Anaerolineales bacterium]|nr:nitroreductase/quinone reductase family protein [Anaerolineales bacterium]
MNKFFLKIFMGANTFFIRVSHGRIGSQLGTQTILLLHSRGRKSGKQYVTPVAYFHTDGFYFLVGSNWGKDQNAAWYHNLLAAPRTLIEVRGRTIPVEAAPAEGPQYDRLWEYAVQHHPPYLHYQEMTTRHIPIMVLKPVVE